tara:strand:+ start:105 stop:278 length:174 start_codon:yes stop_codon:yes gene_type:complete
MVNLQIDLISELLVRKQKQLDGIEWDDPKDPRIEGMLRQIRNYKYQLNQGEEYEPNF